MNMIRSAKNQIAELTAAAYRAAVQEGLLPEGVQTIPAVEIIPRGAYFDYVSKYQKDGAVELCPAPITDAAWKQVGEMALKLHKGLGLSVYSRSDFILDENGQAWCLEINTLPGMTPTSLVPQEAAQVGLNYGELCEKIVELSLAARKAATPTTSGKSVRCPSATVIWAPTCMAR